LQACDSSVMFSASHIDSHDGTVVYCVHIWWCCNGSLHTWHCQTTHTWSHYTYMTVAFMDIWSVPTCSCLVVPWGSSIALCPGVAVPQLVSTYKALYFYLVQWLLDAIMLQS